ncbi:FtsX-like permease family protein [Anaerolineae bacterium CFX7]|nr:FtsX-like permease family protein [Anaerolineae bacterium CFX7]
MNIQLTLAARYLWGRKLRTILTTLAIVFGVFVVFGMNTLLPTITQAFETSVLSASGQVDVLVTNKSGESFAPSILNRIESISGVQAVSGNLERTVNIPPNYYRSGNVGALSLIGIVPKDARQVRDYTIQQGRFLQNADTNVAVITTSLAETLNLKLGDELSMPTVNGAAKLKIVGIRAAQTLPGNEPVWVTLSQAQKLLNASHRINTIEIKLNTTDAAQRTAITNAIAATVGDEYQIGGLASGSELMASLQTAQQIFNLMGFLALFMGGFIIFNTFRTIVAERRHDIGMLRALGAGRRTIIGLFLFEGLLQGIVGTAIGIALGYVLGVLIVIGTRSIYQQFFRMTLGDPVVQPGLVALTITLGVGVTLLSGVLPAWNASRVPPLEALRPTAVTVETRGRLGKWTIAGIVLMFIAVGGLLSHNIALVALGGFAFLIGLTLLAPALVKPIAQVFSALLGFIFARDGTASLAQGNLTRQPSRAAITASATMIGLAVLVAAVGLISSITGGINTLLEKTLGSDYLLIPPSIGVWGGDVGADETLAERLRAVYGVSAVSTMRFATTTVGDQTINLLGIDPVEFPKVSGLNFSEGDSQTAFEQLGKGRGLILNGVGATTLKVRAGDDVKISSPEGEQTYRVVAVASDVLNTKITSAYISQDNLKRDFHKSEDVFYQLNLAPNANRAEVEGRLNEIVARYPQFKLVSGKAYLDEVRSLYTTSFSAFYILLGVLALPSLIAILNTLAIGVIERTREIGMLRAIGATRKQVRRTILAEAILLAAMGAAFGILAGLYLGYVMVLGLNASGLYPVEYAFPYAGALVAVAVGLLFGVLAAILPARQAARMDIIQALRYE